MFQSYVLRIYRYTPGDPESLVGVLKSLDPPAEYAFTNIDKLLELLVHHLSRENRGEIDSRDEDEQSSDWYSKQ